MAKLGLSTRFHVAISRAAPSTALVLLSPLVSACGFPKAGPEPGPLSAADVSRASACWADANEATLASGRDLFTSRCNSCHAYPDLRSIAVDRWPDVMDGMSKKAHLDSTQHEKVLRFILVARESQSAG